MADDNRIRTRQEIYDRIRSSSKEEFILEDMIRLGFWPRTGQPGDPAEEIRRRGELERELRELRARNQRLGNEAALLKELRQRRLAESRKKRQETRERNERERLARAAAWRERRAREIVFLGEGVSGGLSERIGDAERLLAQGLPVLATPEEIAAAMGLTVGGLRFLCFTRRAAPISHYVRFRVPKKTGGQRLISAPMPRLKAAQRWVLEQILAKVAVHQAAHGFVEGRSIVSNAAPHARTRVVVNVDLRDFFPTVGYRRVKGLFRALGYAEAAATVWALLCTEPDVEEVELDGRRFFVPTSERHLPQGAPTSPAITNLLCRRLDRRLHAMATALGFSYTRYADDLTLSAAAEGADVGKALRRLRDTVVHEGFVVHPDKTRVLRRGARQEVTGLVVNERPGVPRDTLRRFRATLFQIEKDGPAGKRWGQSADVLQAVLGFAQYVRMVDPQKGAALVERARALMAQHGGARRDGAAQPVAAGVPEKPVQEQPAQEQPAQEPSGQTPKKKWWKLW